MPTQTMTSELLVDLSTAQQQLLAGGQMMGLEDDNSDDSSSEGEGVGTSPSRRPRRYRINSTAIITVQKLD